MGVHGSGITECWTLVWCALAYTIHITQASAHVCSQLKHQNLGVGSCTEEVLEWFNYNSCASAHLNPKLAARGHRIDLHRHFAPILSNKASQAVENGCIVQENNSPVALLPSLSNVCHIQYASLYSK